MTYYPTLAEDIERAKQILARGLFGADAYATYKLLESFVDAIEVVGVDVVAVALRQRDREGLRRHEPRGAG